MKLRSLFGLASALALLFLFGCIMGGHQDSDTVAKGRGSEVENEVIGRLVTENGQPAVGAKVTALPASSVLAKSAMATHTLAKPDSVFTDSLGRYRFDSLESGNYNLIGDLDGGRLLVLIPDIHPELETSSLDLGIDTLRAPGGIRARILADNQGRVGVLCYIPGTSNLAVSDDSGWCFLDKVPQGVYTVRYSLTGYLVEPDSGVQVLKGKVTNLGIKNLNSDPELPPPTPKNLTGVYDPKNGTVSLTWSPVRVSDLDGYVVYLEEAGVIEPKMRSSGVVRDTFFVDTLNALPGKTRNVTYRVKARDRDATVSSSYSTSAITQVMPAEWYVPHLAWLHSQAIRDSAVQGDTVPLILEYQIHGRPLDTLLWRENDSLIAVRSHPDSEGVETLRYRVGMGEGKTRITAELKDAWGHTYPLTRDLFFFRSRMLAHAGADTSVTLRDSVRLHGIGTGIRMAVASQGWIIGATGSYLASKDGKASFAAPTTSGDVTCVFRVTGVDGSTAEDTLQVRVLRDPPKANAGPDRYASQNGTVILSGSGSDSAGKIVRYEWLAHGDSVFREGSPSYQVTTAGQYDSLLAYVLRVTDDDGNTAVDTAIVHLTPAPFSVSAGADLTVSVKDTLRLTPSATGPTKTWEWDIGSTGAFVLSSNGGWDFVAPDSVSQIACIVRATDRNGKVGLDTVLIEVVLDAPHIDLGPDLTVSINDSLRLMAEATDSLGRIVSLMWDLGSGFIEGSNEKRIQAPALPEDIQVVAKIKDDDGLEASDTMTVHVVLDAPVAAFVQKPGIFPFPGDSIRFTASASRDGHGYITKYEWDWMGDGRYVEQGREAVIPTGIDDAVKTKVLRLRVTDDDGLTDTVSVTYFTGSAEPGWCSFYTGPGIFRKGNYSGASAVFNDELYFVGGHGDGSSRSEITLFDAKGELKWNASYLPIGGRLGHALLVHAGKLWVLGGGAGNQSIWNTVDGMNWSKVVDSVPFGSRAGFASYVFQGRIWVAGGQMDVSSGNYLNDVWSSSDGKNWTLETNHAAFSPRAYMAPFQFDGKLWLTGGDNNASSLTDIWNSSNGRDWVKVGEITSLITPLQQHTTVVHGNTIWTLIPYFHPTPRLLKSTDGVNWIAVDDLDTFKMGPRFAASEFRGHIWALGEFDSSEPGLNGILNIKVVR